MANAIGMVELTSIARGIETSDFMVKAAQVELIRSSTVCPGKYIIIIAGDTGDVKASMAEGIRQGGESVVNTLLLPNAHPQLIPAISMTTQPPQAVRWACWSSIPSPRPLRPPMWPPRQPT
ncbi:BMC domain-containing protein [Flavonifractor plautii]|nr:BMC domain-containing protein [Flavonifractor plautii]